jgi:hypothetical protein
VAEGIDNNQKQPADWRGHERAASLNIASVKLMFDKEKPPDEKCDSHGMKRNDKKREESIVLRIRAIPAPDLGGHD